VEGPTRFASSPATGAAHQFAVGTPELVACACEAAEEAFWSYGYSSREERATFLEAIADEIEARRAAITEIGTQETGLPAARLEGSGAARSDS
jgi:NADP-dependent aldehyde dehydrogenase